MAHPIIAKRFIDEFVVRRQIGHDGEDYIYSEGEILKGYSVVSQKQIVDYRGNEVISQTQIYCDGSEELNRSLRGGDIIVDPLLGETLIKSVTQYKEPPARGRNSGIGLVVIYI